MSTPAQEMIPTAPAFCEGVLHFGPRPAQFNELGAAPVVDTQTGSISTIDETAVFQTRLMVDALRSVAARMTMDELHENRAIFVAEVRDGVLKLFVPRSPKEKPRV
mgnify:CR=1 FL=1